MTIQPRGDQTGPGRAFTAKETYFVADARTHPALAAPLVEATDARSAVFEPVLRDGVVAGVLIVIWRVPLEALPDAPGGVLRLLAAQAAVAIEHARCASASPALSFTDPLTGLATRRMWDEELPRELARTRRSRVAADDRRDRHRPHERVQHAARRARGRPPDQGVAARAGATSCARSTSSPASTATEFAMVLPGCGLGEACDVLDRVRESTPRGQTASAGVARWDGEEPAELFLARAQDALAAAKSAGRNVTIAAD